MLDHWQKSARNTFAGYPLDRVQQPAKDPAWVAAQMTQPNARFLPVWRAQTLMADASHPTLLRPDEVAPLLPQAESVVLLGQAEGFTYFSLALPADAPPAALSAYGAFQDLRAVGPLVSHFEGGLLAYARAMAHWHTQHRFCGVCGQPTESAWGGHMRRCLNPACAQQHFPRTDPAIIVLTTFAERALLGRQAQWTPGRYSTIAGFVAPGESLEDAVAREVQEETGVRVKTVTYHSSQPWPFPQSLMVGFTAEAAAATLCTGPDCSDGELEDARWFTRAEMRQGIQAGTLSMPSGISISFRLIADWFDAGDEGRLADWVR